MAYWQQNNSTQAQKYFAYLLRNYAFTPTEKGGKTPDAILMLGKINEKKKPKDSKAYYKLVLKLYPNSQSSAKASSLLKNLN